MLTQDDLQQLKTLIRTEVEAEGERTRQELQSEIKLTRMELDTRLGNIENRVKNIEIKISQIQKDISVIVNYYDRETITLHKRLKEIESNLGLNSS